MKETENIIDRKIRKKMIFFTVMFVVSLILSVVFVIRDYVPFLYVLIAFVSGSVIGAVLSRIQNVSWDKDKQKIVKEFDLISGILLFFMILFIIFKKQIIESFIHLPKITAIIFALNSGIMLGRILLIRHQIKTILLHNKN